MTDQQEAQQMLMQMQKKQQQLQQVEVQKEETESEIQETKRALEEIEEDDGQEVYKSVGSILVEQDREELKQELQEKIEDLRVRKKSLDNKTTKLQEEVEEFREEFSQGMM